MRGKVPLPFFADSLTGITPAYAGKRVQINVRFERVQDHPRLCGEKGRRIALFHADVGSPPPMRGKVTFLKNILSLIRITPAYAGKRR